MVSSSGETTCWHFSSSTTGLTYDQGKSYCSAEGGQIASIISHEEQSFVANMLPTVSEGELPNYCNPFAICSYWIGNFNHFFYLSIFILW